MKPTLLALLFSVTFVTVSAVYVHDRVSNPDDVQHVVTCPQGCQCSEGEMTAQCHFSYQSYSFEHLSPWKLTRLRIHGDISVSQQRDSKQSVKDVIYGDRDGPLGKEDKLKKARFSRLTHVDVSYVPIHQISEFDFSDLPLLQLISLTNDNISVVDPKAFKQSSNLEELNLNYNQISSLSEDTFRSLTKLKKLHLRSNRLTSLTENLFSSLLGLEHLDLRNNYIEHLETFVHGLSNLNVLDLRGNEIIYVSEESVKSLQRFENVLIGGNPFWCSCKLRSLIEAYRFESMLFDDSVECSSPGHLEHVKFRDIEFESLPCESANVSDLSLSSSVLYQGSLVLDCKVTGDFPLAVYWLTPWGETFANNKSISMFPEEFLPVQTEKTYSALNLLVTSRVYVGYNGSLHIDKYRGHFAGDFTCVAVNLIGQSNRTISIGIETKLRFLYITSLFVGALSGGSMLIIAIIIGMLRLFVNKCIHSESCKKCCCCHCDDVKIVDEVIKPEDLKVEVDVKVSSSESSLDDTDYDPSLPPPDPPVNSPQLRLSPDKCETPDSKELEEEIKVTPPIWDQLEEVRARLRCGAERKMEKVRSHVRSITDTGSLKIRNFKDAGSMKIQSIKETGSHAASKMKKNMASGMVQVKYGVQSIKEFCGTGDMGPGTISMVSVSTDVDTKERVQMVRSHSFV